MTDDCEARRRNGSIWIRWALGGMLTIAMLVAVGWIAITARVAVLEASGLMMQRQLDRLEMKVDKLLDKN